MTHYDYATAFSRNIGWLTEGEQAALRGKCVAIAGMGGVGGFHLLTLARLGVGQFHIADLDTFELANFNRQAGATLSSLDRPKVDAPSLRATSIPNSASSAFPPASTRPILPRSFAASTSTSTGWISSPSTCVSRCSPTAPSTAFRPSRSRRSA